MSACEKARGQVLQTIQNDPKHQDLVAKFDFSILITMAVQLLMQYLGNCLNVDPAKAESRAQDSIWYPYFVKKAAKEAVKQKYKGVVGANDARDVLADAISALSAEDRKAIIEETKQAESDAGLLI